MTSPVERVPAVGTLPRMSSLEPNGSQPVRHTHGHVLRALVAVSASVALIVALASGVSFVSFLGALDEGKDIELPGPIAPSSSPGEEPREPQTTKCAEEPCNYLILGSDSRDNLTEEELEQFGTDADIGGENRADTIMLVHVDPDEENATILSFPRDLWVEIPGHGPDKINAAFEGGLSGDGPELTARTVANLTGLQIDHILYVDLAGFQGVVNTLGGADMCIPPYHADPATGRLVDPLTGLDIAPGCQHLEGDQALAYVRTRHLYCDNIPDFSRIGRQQQFLRAVINQMLQPETLTRAPFLIRPILGNLHRDKRFSVGDLIVLVGKLQGLTTGAAEFRSIPGYEGIEDGLSVVKMDPSARELFDAIREGRSIEGVGETLLNTPPSEANIEVASVVAGSSTADAERVLEVLSLAGFAVDGSTTTTDDVGLNQRATSAIAFAPGNDAAAQVVHAYFPQLKVYETDALAGYDVAIVVADDYEEPPTGGDPPVGECPSA